VFTKSKPGYKPEIMLKSNNKQCGFYELLLARRILEKEKETQAKETKVKVYFVLVFKSKSK